MIRFGRQIAVLHRKTQVFWTEWLNRQQITAAEYPIMIYLLDQDKQETASQDEVAQHLMVDKSAVARAVQSLLDKGFITREKDATDRRINRIILTEKGKNTKESIYTGIDVLNNRLLDGFTVEEKNALVGFLDRMTENMKK